MCYLMPGTPVDVASGTSHSFISISGHVLHPNVGEYDGGSWLTK